MMKSHELPMHSTGTVYRESTSPVTSLHRGRVMRHVTIAGTLLLVLCHVAKSLQLIWISGTRRWNLRVPDFQMSCSDLT